MVALHGAVALAEADDIAVFIGQDLHLDMPGGVDVLLQIHRAVAEGAQALFLRG